MNSTTPTDGTSRIISQPAEDTENSSSAALAVGGTVYEVGILGAVGVSRYTEQLTPANARYNTDTPATFWDIKQNRAHKDDITSIINYIKNNDATAIMACDSINLNTIVDDNHNTLLTLAIKADDPKVLLALLHIDRIINKDGSQKLDIEFINHEGKNLLELALDSVSARTFCLLSADFKRKMLCENRNYTNINFSDLKLHKAVINSNFSYKDKVEAVKNLSFNMQSDSRNSTLEIRNFVKQNYANLLHLMANISDPNLFNTYYEVVNKVKTNPNFLANNNNVDDINDFLAIESVLNCNFTIISMLAQGNMGKEIRLREIKNQQGQDIITILVNSDRDNKKVILSELLAYSDRLGGQGNHKKFDLNNIDNLGKTALDYALEQEEPEIVMLLLEEKRKNANSNNANHSNEYYDITPVNIDEHTSPPRRNLIDNNQFLREHPRHPYTMRIGDNREEIERSFVYLSESSGRVYDSSGQVLRLLDFDNERLVSLPRQEQTANQQPLHIENIRMKTNNPS